MATTPQFTSTPVLTAGQVYIQNTGRDGSGDLTDLITGSANGTKIEHIDIIASGSTSTGAIRFFLSNNTNNYLLLDQPISIVAATGSVAPFSTSIDFTSNNTQFILPSNYIIKAATYKSEPFNIFIYGGNF